MTNVELSVKDLQALLEDAQAAERVIAEEARRERTRLRKAFLNTMPYKYEVSPVGSHPSGNWGIYVSTQDRVYVSQKLDPEAYESFVRNRPVSEEEILALTEQTKIVGMQYYLTLDGIIHHTGGGTLVLKTPQLCSSDEWAQIKAGNIPAKFLMTGLDHE
jgi:hypothetical protein